MASGGGFTFGQSQTPFGSGTSLFGQTTGATQQQTQQPFAFGQPSVTTQSSAFSFGQPSAVTTQSSAFSFPSFGAGSTVTTATAPSFGANTFNFTAPITSTTSVPPFSFGSNNLFGAPRPSQSQFNFSTPIGGTQLTQQQPQQGVVSFPASQVIPNVFTPKIFNDERDDVLGQFNRIQAYFGHGKAFYNANLPPIELTQSQGAHRFKAITYADIRNIHAENENKIGILVKTNGDATQLKTMILQYENNVKNLLGNAIVKIEYIKMLPDNKALLNLAITETAMNKKIPANQLQQFLNQQHIKTQLNNVFLNTFVSIVPLSLSKQELEEYLNNPTFGIDRLLWSQAKKENPDPNKFIPVPLVGFSALNERFKLQEKETEQQKMRLKIVNDDVMTLQRDVSSTKAKLDECKRKHLILSNRVLKHIITQEVRRRRGFPIQAEEDQLRAKLEALQSELNAPTKFQGCLNELMSQLRQMQNQQQFGTTVSLDDPTLNEVKTFLKQEHEGIQHLIAILKSDINDYNLLKCEQKQ